GERLLARGNGGGCLLAAGRIEVGARADCSEPLLMAGEIGVGLLELGVGGPAAAALEAGLLVELPRSLDHLVVLLGSPLLPHVYRRLLVLSHLLQRVDDLGL